jgi:hypothetical protein
MIVIVQLSIDMCFHLNHVITYIRSHIIPSPIIIIMTNQIRHDYMTIFNSSDVGTCLYEVFCKNIRMLFLNDHSNRMFIPRPFQRKFKK